MYKGNGWGKEWRGWELRREGRREGRREVGWEGREGERKGGETGRGGGR